MSETKNYHRRGKSKFLLKGHLIFVVKYRHDLLKHQCIANCVKEKIISLQTNEFSIDMMEVDKDHIHLLIDYVPQISISQIVRKQRNSCMLHLNLLTNFLRPNHQSHEANQYLLVSSIL
jgi:putative transposase